MSATPQHASNAPRFISGFVTQADLDFYQRKGAICIRGIIDAETVAMLRKATAEVIEARLAAAEAAGTPRPVGPQFHTVTRPSDYSEALNDFRLNSALPKIASDLMQSQKVVLFGDTLFDKEAGAKVKSPWHHDIPYWPLRGDQVCSTWLALDPVTKENGALEYIAGSHKWGRMFRPLDFGGAGPPDNDFEAIPNFDAERDRHEILSWELNPGDVLIHHGLTVHGAGENTHLDQGRRAYAPRYVGDDAQWEPKYYMERTNPRAVVLRKGDPLDRYGIHPVALDLGAA